MPKDRRRRRLSMAFGPLALAPLIGPASSAVGADSIEQRAFWATAFDTAKTYAADMTLLAYCFRKDPDTSAAIYLTVIGDLNGAIELAGAGAVTPRQTAAFVHQILDATHFPTLDASDAALDKACVDENAVKAYFSLQPISWPLAMRPPFNKK